MGRAATEKRCRHCGARMDASDTRDGCSRLCNAWLEYEDRIASLESDNARLRARVPVAEMLESGVDKVARVLSDAQSDAEENVRLAAELADLRERLSEMEGSRDAHSEALLASARQAASEIADLRSRLVEAERDRDRYRQAIAVAVPRSCNEPGLVSCYLFRDIWEEARASTSPPQETEG